MAGIISVTDDKDWSAANWAYWSLMDHLVDAFIEDPDTARRMEGCKWMQSLSIPMLRKENPELAIRVLTKLKSVAERCAAGDLGCMVEGKPLDDAGQKQFRETMSDLVSMLGEEVPSCYGGA